jgi:hypothetical protein
MRRFALLFGLLLAAGCAPARAEMAVYAVDGLARVRPNAPVRVASSIAICAARNEYEPFQVIVHAGTRPLSGVNVTATDLRSNNGAVISASNLTFYREHYVQITIPSENSLEGSGWYPDALIPFAPPPAALRMNLTPRFAGAPFRVNAGQNQAVWVDVYVPKGTVAGDYIGIVTVSAGNEKPVQISVQITVWNITLPDTPSLRSNFGKLGTDIAKAHGVEMNSGPFRTPEWNYGMALAAHRISPIITNTDYPRVHGDGTIDYSRKHAALKKWIDTFHVTGFPIRLLGDDPAGRDRARNITHLRVMYAYLKANGWEKMAYVYVLDEPNSAAEYEEVRKRARLIHDAQPGIKVLCTEQPIPEHKEWGTLIGSIDIWVISFLWWDDAAVAERLRAGDEVWSYTGISLTHLGRIVPFWEIDFPLLNFRIPTWINWRYGVRGLLYYSPVNWGQTPDVWTQPANYHTPYNEHFNGDGSLFYPGSAVGINGPVVSMRLQQIREGFEDYEYLKLLADRGDRAFVDETVRTIARSWTDWDKRPQALYDARAAIARRLTRRQ